MKVLYIGGTGEISYSCLHASAAAGHDVTVFNRGRCTEPMPPHVNQIIGDLTDDASYTRLGENHWDVVCQFKAYTTREVDRDIKTFAGKVGQYLFISSASVYSKPPHATFLTEAHPTENKFWAYSREKVACERLLLEAHAAGKMPATIVRPSHTYRRNFPGGATTGDEMAWRLMHGKPVIVHGDGTSLWTYTHAEDFAPPFVKLLGNPRASGEVFHLTNHLRGYSWNQIIDACAAGLGVKAQLVHIPSETLVRLKPDLEGNLLGDKTWTSLFDCSKVRALVGAYEQHVTLEDGLRAAAVHVRHRLQTHKPDEMMHAFWDRAIDAQRAIG